jgi:hypothetical protein
VLRLDRMESWKAQELFERETAVLRTLNHPGIPAWIDDFPLDDAAGAEGFALIQELIPGRSLHEVMRTGTLSSDEMLVWFDQILQVLTYLHERAPAVIHRDITPKNIILRPDGGAALVDFGSVQAALRAGGTGASTAAGTFGYAPIEQFVGRAEPASDLYGLGMTYLAVATGREPSEMPLDGARVDLRAQLQGKERLLDLLHAMTAADPRSRPASARSVRARLALLDAPEGTPATASTGDPATARVSDVTGYLTLLRDRLRGEGFSVMEGGLLGDLTLALTATRERGARQTSAIKVFVARASQLPGVDGWRTFVAAAARARGGRHWLRGTTTVIPVAITATPGEIPPQAPGGPAEVVPVWADLASGEARVLVEGQGLGRDGLATVSYAWWLATPRLAPRPTLAARSSLMRIAAGLAAGIVLLCGAALAAVLAVPHGTFYLSYATDALTGRVVVKEVYRKPFLVGTAVHTLDPMGGSSAQATLPADAYLCEFGQRQIGYWRSIGTGRVGYFRAALDGSQSHALIEVASAGRVSCAIRGDQIAYPVAEAPGVAAGIWQGGGHGAPQSPQRIDGSEAGDQDATWFPSADALLVAYGPRAHERLFRIDRATGLRTIVMDDAGGGQTHPSVSPDGNTVAFYRTAHRNFAAAGAPGAAQVHDLELLDLASGQARVLVQDVCFSVAPVWRGSDELLLGKWLTDRCALFAYRLATDQVTLLAREY